jgi:3-oxoacyl-[acyl-carrier-protein] synthase-3
LQNKLQLTSALPFAISQGCNSQLLSLELVSRFLLSSEKDAAVIVAADNFSTSKFDRWNADYSIVYGDAAAAMTISKTSGIAKILSLHSFCDAEMESLHRLEQHYSEQDSDYADKHYGVKKTKKASSEELILAKKLRSYK